MKSFFPEKRKKILLWIMALSVTVTTFNACLSDYNWNNMDVKFNPEIIVPLAYGTFVLDDIFQAVYTGDSLLDYDKDSLMRFYYHEDSIYKQTAAELFELPEDFNVDSQSIKVGYVPIDINPMTYKFTLRELLEKVFPGIDVSGFQGTKLALTTPYSDTNVDLFELDNSTLSEIEYLNIHQGKIAFTLKNNFPTSIGLEAEIFNDNGTSGGEEILAVVKFESVGVGQTETKYADIAGKQMSNKTKARIVKKQADATTSDFTVELEDAVEISLEFQDILISEGRGIFPGIPEYTQTDTFNVSLEEDYALTLVKTKKALLQMDVKTNIPADGDLTILFPHVIDTVVNKPKEVTLKVKSNGHEIDPIIINADNCILDLSAGTEGLSNKLVMQYSISLDKSDKMVTIKHTDSIQLKLKIHDFEFYYLEGDLGQQEIELNSGNVEFPNSFWEDFRGSLKFESPRLEFIARNSIGIPNKMLVQFTGHSKEGGSVSLNPEPFVIGYPTYPLSYVVESSLLLDQHNSNLVNFVALPPTKSVDYEATLLLNPEDLNGSNRKNRIVPDAFLQLGYELELPMNFSSDKLTFDEVIDINEISIDDSGEATLIVRYKNKIPLQIVLEIDFVNSQTGAILGSFDPVDLQAAISDDEGKATDKTVGEERIVMDEDFINLVEGADQIVVTGSFITPESGDKPAKLYQNDFLDLKILLQAKLNLTNDDNEE